MLEKTALPEPGQVYRGEGGVEIQVVRVEVGGVSSYMGPMDVEVQCSRLDGRTFLIPACTLEEWPDYVSKMERIR